MEYLIFGGCVLTILVLWAWGWFVMIRENDPSQQEWRDMQKARVLKHAPNAPKQNVTAQVTEKRYL